MPTLKWCIENASEDSYVVEGLERFREDKTPAGVPSNIYDEYMEGILENVRILPINSDPVRKDGDGDSYEDPYDMKPLNKKNNGEWVDIFTEENWKFYQIYNKIENKEIFTDEEIQTFLQMKEKITLIQQSLEHLGYLDMEDNSYGTFGGSTRCALQLYQLNHGFEPLKYGEKGIDINTYSDLVNNAVNHDFVIEDSDAEIGSKEQIYDYYAKEYGLKETYYDVRKVVELPLDSKLLNAGVTVVERYVENDIQREKEEIYYEDYYIYDYTEMLDNVLYYGAKEFHDKHYICGAKNNKNDEEQKDNDNVVCTYDDSEYYCVRIGDQKLWVYNSVKNNAKYDIKIKARWDDWMDIIGEDIYYYGSRFPFLFYGYVRDAEGFGNILYGSSGNAGGYELKLLTQLGSLYSFATELSFDNNEDRENITIGYLIYESKKREYGYLH